jgi:hypothetical protein
MEKLKELTHFITNISELWNSQDFNKILQEVKQKLADSAIPLEEWNVNLNDIDGPGIYCFWYEGDKLPFEKFKKNYLIDGKALSLSKPYKKWYDQDKTPIAIDNDSVKAYSFYLGKREGVLGRISQHMGAIYSSPSTYGMHLKRNHKLKGQLYVGYWMLPFTIVKPLDKYVLQQVLTFLESELRNELAPWVGKQ